MKTAWTKGLDEQLKKDVEASFKSSTIVRKRLTELCEEKVAASQSTDKTQYDSPNWTYMQADNIGYRRALKEIISLLEK